MRAALRRHALVAAIRGDEGAVFRSLSAREWRAVVTDAMDLGIGGQLHERVRDADGATVPEVERQRLRDHYYAVGARNALLLSALTDVLRALDAAGVPTIVLKGAALVESAYGDFGARTMDDLDLLVRPADLDRAAAALERIGFAPDEWFRGAEWYRASLHHLVPYERAGVTVEVHHRLLPPTMPQTVEPDALWARSAPATFAGVAARRLSPADELVHLAQHLALSHKFIGGLSRLRDVAALARASRDRLDWDAVVAASRGVERWTFVALRLAQRVAAAAIPAAALDRLRHEGRVGRLEGALALAVAERLCVRIGDATAVPEWLSVRALEELTETRGWLRRAANLTRAVVANWRRAGERRGFRWFAIPYGMFAAPWRRLRGAATSHRPTH